MGKSKKLSTDGRSGGLLVGKTDIDGGIGIPATVGGSRNVILGGGEIIINEAAAKLHCEKLDEINQSTGGRSIDCEAQKTANKGRFDGGGRAYGGNFTGLVLYHVTEKENREDIQSDGLLKSEGVVWLSIDGKSLQLLVEDGDFSLPGRPKPELDIWQVRIPEKELGKLKGGYDMGFLDDWSAYSGNIPVEWIKLIDKKDWNNHYAGGGNFTGTKQNDKASEDDLATLKAKVEKLLSDNGININELEVRTLKTWGGDVRVYLGSMTTQNKKTSFRKTGQTEKVGNQTRHYGERGVHETKTRNYVVFNEADFKEYDDNPKYSMINYNIEEIKKHYFADGGGMYWMGNEGDRVVVDKSGQGDFTSYYLIREKSPHDMVSMSFDSRFEAEKYAKRRKMVLVDKYVDEYSDGGSLNSFQELAKKYNK